jgi:probable rRNA maturation factor
MLQAVELPEAELSIVLTGDEQIKKLNRTFRKKDKATDVLSFPMREGEAGEVAGGLLGDVVISVPTAARQAKDKGVRVLEEVTFLLAHGLLHLLGWDHDTVSKDRAMTLETRRLCAAATPARAPRARRG